MPVLLKREAGGRLGWLEKGWEELQFWAPEVKGKEC